MMDIDVETVSENEQQLPSADVEMAEPTGLTQQPTQQRKETDQKSDSKLTRLMKKSKIKVTTVTMRLYRCRICFMSLTTSEDLVNHLELVHNLQFEGSPVIQPKPRAASNQCRNDRRAHESKLKCLKCPKLFGGMNVLSRHLRSDHLMDATSVVIYFMLFGSVKCPFCTRSFPFHLYKHDKDIQMAAFHQHIAARHPNSHFPSPADTQKRKQEMKWEMNQQHLNVRTLRRSPSPLPPLIPELEVVKTEGSELGVRVMDVDVSPEACTIKVGTGFCLTEEDAEMHLSGDSRSISEPVVEEKPLVLSLAIPLTTITLKTEIPNRRNRDKCPASPAPSNDNEEGTEKHRQDSSEYIFITEEVKKEEENSIMEEEHDVAENIFEQTQTPPPAERPAQLSANEEGAGKHGEDDPSDFVYIIHGVKKEEETPMNEEELNLADYVFEQTPTPPPAEPADWETPNAVTETLPVTLPLQLIERLQVIESLQMTDEDSGISGTAEETSAEVVDWVWPTEKNNEKPGTAETIEQLPDWTCPISPIESISKESGTDEAFEVKPIFPEGIEEPTVMTIRDSRVMYVIHMNMRLFRCLECGEMFTSRDEMVLHVKEVHFLQAPDSSDSDPTSNWPLN